ncbi:nucleoside-diphosphate sugar epimerase/dehydratase [Paraflavitalea sp. CAU 1676]|uniref:polysaccharide biosynthesis protein n=1 Tax=Paraflavitalea sp. CAU 1676 TaxID=3032598 RepID=UPI0023DA340E|nr:nucleoside-diphosphate sugar epimerase/dehydratase [Paraflavitalea sp. CAU 1676]MDF2189674.1 nucleoside-diphosphate sugar epimerase/dehydratase [Paraflavitalea sp. CAU 1676]
MKKLFFIAKSVPRWVVLLVDLAINGASFSLSYFIVKQFEFHEILRGHFFIYTGVYGIIALLIFYCMRIHTGIIRYSNIHDMLRIFMAVALVSLLYPVAIEFLVARRYHIRSLNMAGVLIVNFFIASSLLVLMRTVVRGFYYYVKRTTTGSKENVLIYGADTEAILIKQAIESSPTNQFVIAGFIETDASKVNSYIQQVKIFHIRALGLLKMKKNIDKLILMNNQLTGPDKKTVIEKCLQVGIKVLTVPPSDQWVYGKLSIRQIQELRIEDLLQREPIVINDQNISNELSGKKVLITGAAGSIGAEVVRQVLSYHPETVILCDQAESDLHEMQLEVEEKYPDINIHIFIASIRDRNRMEIPFRQYRPDIVFHAAAYKHVPMMEKHPAEAILTNVMGTKIVADLAVFFNVHKFVMISTDKAVNPSNVMGTSKRIAEMYVQSLSNIVQNKSAEDIVHINNSWSRQFIFNAMHSKTKFITTRFGNVLGSNGSVIPRFRAQIEAGGPVTVTHPLITRFFMTIPEAVQLVLEAATMGRGSEIFVFDMGRPVKITDLATKMIRLAGLIPEEDIKIVYTGLRPGEKLYEELLNREEKTLPTHHSKIKIARVVPCCDQSVMEINELIGISRHGDDYELVKKMKELVPEFKSNNSEFEELDHIEIKPALLQPEVTY